MPWTAADVERHNKGLTAQAKTVWVQVANGELGRGATEASAIRQANTAADRIAESNADGYSLRDDMARAMSEAGDDHPYGAWRGGSKSSGGGPASVKGKGTKTQRRKEMADRVGAENVGRDTALTRKLEKKGSLGSLADLDTAAKAKARSPAGRAAAKKKALDQMFAKEPAYERVARTTRRSNSDFGSLATLGPAAKPASSARAIDAMFGTAPRPNTGGILAAKRSSGGLAAKANATKTVSGRRTTGSFGSLADIRTAPKPRPSAKRAIDAMFGSPARNQFR